MKVKVLGQGLYQKYDLTGQDHGEIIFCRLHKKDGVFWCDIRGSEVPRTEVWRCNSHYQDCPDLKEAKRKGLLV